MFADILKKARNDKSMNQTELAKLCGVSRNTIVNWETGKSMPKYGDVEKLSLILGISRQELMGYDNDGAYTGQKERTPKGVAYWGGIVDETRRVVERGDTVEMKTIEPLLRLAHDVLLLGMAKLKNGASNMAVSQPSVSAYNGDFSKYSGNTLTVGVTG